MDNVWYNAGTMIPKEKLELLFFSGLFLGVGVITFLVFKPFFTTLFLAITFAVVLYPIYSWIARLFGGRRGIASVVAIFISFVFIMLPLFFLGQQAFEQANGLYNRFANQNITELESAVSYIEAPIQKIIPDFEINLDQSAEYALGWVKDNFRGFVFGTITIVFDLFLIFIALFFFLRDGSKFIKTIITLSPLENKYDEEIILRIGNTLTTVIKGTLFIAFIQGLLVGIGLYIFGVPNAILWAALAAVCAFVPGLGTGIVVIPSVVYLIIIGNVPSAIGMACWGLLLVGTIDNFLTPYFYGRGTKVHSLIMLFSVLGGISLFGPEGFIFGPVIASLFITTLGIYRTLVLEKRI